MIPGKSIRDKFTTLCEKIFKFIGSVETPLFEPVIRLVSSSISCRTFSKSVKI